MQPDAPPAYTSITEEKPSRRTGNIAKVHVLLMASLWVFLALLVLYSDLSREFFWTVFIPLLPLPVLGCGYYGIERKKIGFIIPLIIFTALFFLISLLTFVAGAPILFFGAIKAFKVSGIYNGGVFALIAVCLMLVWSTLFLKSTIDVTLMIRRDEINMLLDA